MSTAQRLRMADILGSFAFAGDLGQGQSLGHVLATTRIAMRLAEAMSLSSQERADVYYTALLMHSGCTAGASDVASFLQSDELAAQAELCLFDPDNVAQFMKWLARSVAPGWPLYLRVLKTVQAMARADGAFREMAVGWSDVAARIAERLGMSEDTRRGLYYICETWNGKGPHRLKGPDIPLPARVVMVAMTLEIMRTTEGPSAARDAARARRGKSFDPDVVDAFASLDDAAWQDASREDSWDAVLAVEPEPWLCIDAAGLDDVALAFADYADLKTPATPRHSRRTAELAEAVARRLNLDAAEVTLTRRAALVHDIGQVAVPTLILEKKGPLTATERERFQLHAHYTGSILGRSGALRPLAQAAADHHERLDGSGYSRGLAGSQISLPARIIGLADRYVELTATDGAGVEAALAALEPDAGPAFDAEVYRALRDVLGAGPGSPPRPAVLPAGLTEREVEVLRLVAQGLTLTQVAERLVLSKHTARHHLESIYSKIGVSSRAGAVLFAVEHDILR